MATGEHSAPVTLLALDFGLRRIGIASGSPVTGTAAPLATIAARDGQPDWPELDRLVKDWRPDLLVLGLPYNSDGSESDMTARVREFEELLKSRYGLRIVLTDERYTSAEAESVLKNMRRTGIRNKKLKKEDVDSLAAALIAESWMRGEQNDS